MFLLQGRYLRGEMGSLVDNSGQQAFPAFDVLDMGLQRGPQIREGFLEVMTPAVRTRRSGELGFKTGHGVVQFEAAMPRSFNVDRFRQLGVNPGARGTLGKVDRAHNHNCVSWTKAPIGSKYPAYRGVHHREFGPVALVPIAQDCII